MAGIIRYLKNEILNLMPNTFVDKTLRKTNFLGFASISFSQEGEDMILSKLFEEKEKGFFIDIGAHHPIRFSNTYKLYLNGWRGINIDAMPNSMNLFKKYRKEDINLEIPISKVSKTMPFYTYNEPALNTFSEELAKERGEAKQIYNLETKTLSEVLDQYMPKNIQKIDFMSIDVEGLDFEVLESNDWAKYKPTVILIESLSTAKNISDSLNSEVAHYLYAKNYSLYSKSDKTLFFMLNE